jgi:DNA invertase Pin-like site-specific DNA recombinase
MRAALYARVSTRDKDQDPEAQLEQLRRYCALAGWSVSQIYKDVGVSGSTERRAELDLLLEKAAQSTRPFDVVVVWKFDRFARNVRFLIQSLEKFRACGIEFVSITEKIDTTTPMGKMVFTVLGAIAELESGLISERVKAGMQNARRKGKHLGRPSLEVDGTEILELRSQGKSLRAIAAALGTSRSFVQLWLHRWYAIPAGKNWLIRAKKRGLLRP